MFSSLSIHMLATAVNQHQLNRCLKLLVALFARRLFPHQFIMHTVICIKHRHDCITSLPKYPNVFQIHSLYFLNSQPAGAALDELGVGYFSSLLTILSLTTSQHIHAWTPGAKGPLSLNPLCNFFSTYISSFIPTLHISSTFIFCIHTHIAMLDQSPSTL